MATIKKQYVVDRHWIDAGEGNTHPMTLSIDIQPEMVEIKLYGTDDNSIINMWHKIPLSTFTDLKGMYGQSAWIVPHKFALSEVDGAPAPLTVESYMLIDMFAGSFNRRGARVADVDLYEHSVYSIFVPSTQADFTECTFVIRTPQGDDEYTLVGGTADGVITGNKELVDPITMTTTSTSVEPDGSVTVNVTSSSYVDEIYLEQISGIPNKKRVDLVNGQGKFKLYATGLEVGEVAKVKAGHKKFVGFSSLDIPVV